NQSSSLHSCNGVILKSLLNSKDDDYAYFKQNYMNARKENLNFLMHYENSKSTEETFCVFNEEGKNKRLLFFDYIRKNFDPGIFQVINKSCMTKYKSFLKSKNIEQIFNSNRNGIYIFYDNLNFNFMDVLEFSHLEDSFIKFKNSFEIFFNMQEYRDDDRKYFRFIQGKMEAERNYKFKFVDEAIIFFINLESFKELCSIVPELSIVIYFNEYLNLVKKKKRLYYYLSLIMFKYEVFKIEIFYNYSKKECNVGSIKYLMSFNLTILTIRLFLKEILKLFLFHGNTLQIFYFVNLITFFVWRHGSTNLMLRNNLVIINYLSKNLIYRYKYLFACYGSMSNFNMFVTNPLYLIESNFTTEIIKFIITCDLQRSSDYLIYSDFQDFISKHNNQNINKILCDFSCDYDNIIIKKTE
ncbi:hypothetical protein H312_00898, partial [Anncaliia algerae PRA339]